MGEGLIPMGLDFSMWEEDWGRMEGQKVNGGIMLVLIAFHPSCHSLFS
jgi:hypothetical protein